MNYKKIPSTNSAKYEVLFTAILSDFATFWRLPHAPSHLIQMTAC